MKHALFLFLMSISIMAFAQAPDSSSSLNINTEITIATRNIWRGLDYGTSPSLQATLAWSAKRFEVGAFATTTLNGNKSGYGNWIELYATYKLDKFSFTLDDYFFFNSADSLNNYFDYGRGATQHIVEGRVKYDTDKLDIFAGYPLYRNENDDTQGVYIEMEYSPYENLSFVLAGLTAASALSFYDDGGVTMIGINGKRKIEVSKNFSLAAKVSIIANPSYKNAAAGTGVGNNPIYVVAALTF